MTVYPLVQAVRSPDVGSGVLWDFNTETRQVDHDSFAVGSPSLLGDPGGVGSDYGLKELSWRERVRGPQAQALAAQAQLARVLLRDEFYLHVKLAPNADSVWFHILRSTPGAVSLSEVDLERETNDWLFDVSLMAKPFHMGSVVRHEVTVGNNPATGGLSVVLPTIKGDAPAPLTVEMAAGTSAFMRPLVSTIPLDGVTWPGTVAWEAESLTLVSATAAVAAVAGSSGGSRVNILVPAADGWTRQVQGQVSVPFAGRWRLYARTTIYGLGPLGITPTLGVRGAGNAASAPAESFITTGGAQYLDLGIFTFPRGNMPTERGYTLTADEVAIEARTMAGTPLAAIDVIVAVPVDLPVDQAGPGRLLDFTKSATTSGTLALRMNGDIQRLELLAAGAHVAVTPNRVRGGFPVVHPDATNVLHFMSRRHSVANQTVQEDNLTGSVTLQLSYRPRYLYFAAP